MKKQIRNGNVFIGDYVYIGNEKIPSEKYRGDRTLGERYFEEDVFRHGDNFWRVKQGHNTTANNAPTEGSPSFEKLPKDIGKGIK